MATIDLAALATQHGPASPALRPAVVEHLKAVLAAAHAVGAIVQLAVSGISGV